MFSDGGATSNVFDLRPLDRIVFRKWSLEIMVLLADGGRVRYQGILAGLVGISTRTLTDRLVGLRALGIVARFHYDTVPPRVEYELTVRGRTILEQALPLVDHLIAARTRRPPS